MAALNEARSFHTESDVDAKSVGELMVMFGLGRTAVKERVRRLVQKGRLEAVFKYKTDITGRVQRLVAYRFKE